MPRNPEAKVVITGVDKISKTLDKVTRKFPKLNKEIRKSNVLSAKLSRRFGKLSQSMGKFGKSSVQTGKSLSTGLTLPILGFGAAAIKVNADFQTSFNKVEAKAKVSGKTFDQLNMQARDLGSTTQFSATQAADAMAFLAQAGFNTNQIFKTTPTVLNLAAASGEDLAFTADILSNTMGAFNIKAEDSARVADVMAAALGGSNVDMQQFADTMKFVAPVAKDFGASVEDTSAAIGFLGNIGIQGSNAATALKQAFLGLAAPTSGARKVLDQVGVTVADSNGKLRPFIDIIGDMGAKLQDLPQATKIKVLNEVFGKRGIAGASELLKKAIGGNNSDLAKFAEELKNSQGAAKRMADTMQKGLPGAINRVKSAFEGMLLTIGVEGGLNGVFEKLLDKLSGFFAWVSKINPTVLKWGLIIAGVAAALGPFLVVLGFTVQALGALLPLVKLLATAFGVLKGIGAVALVIGKFALAINPVVLAVGGLVAGLIRLISVWDEVKSAFAGSSGVFSGLGNAAKVFFGFGGDAPKPAGTETKAGATAQAQQNNLVQTNNARVDVGIKGLPIGSTIKSSGISSLDASFMGLQGI